MCYVSCCCLDGGFFCALLLYNDSRTRCLLPFYTTVRFAGIYEFTFEDGTTVRGRYSFVYTYENGEWKIAHHHSSIMPEGAVAAMKKFAQMENTI